MDKEDYPSEVPLSVQVDRLLASITIEDGLHLLIPFSEAHKWRNRFRWQGKIQ